jgi:hypothetical protein
MNDSTTIPGQEKQGNKLSHHGFLELLVSTQPFDISLQCLLLLYYLRNS